MPEIDPKRPLEAPVRQHIRRVSAVRGCHRRARVLQHQQLPCHLAEDGLSRTGHATVTKTADDIMHPCWTDAPCENTPTGACLALERKHPTQQRYNFTRLALLIPIDPSEILSS